jgi:hypothetical protein
MQNYKLEREVTNTADWEQSVKKAKVGIDWTAVPSKKKNKKKKKKKRRREEKRKRRKREE